MRRTLPLSIWFLATLFVASGVLHFAFPALYTKIVPPYLPAASLLVLLSGAAEVLGGVGLLFDSTRRFAAIGLVVLLFAVWPANVQMLLDARQADASRMTEALMWLRLPLQVVLIVWVWRARRLRALHAYMDSSQLSRRR